VGGGPASHAQSCLNAELAQTPGWGPGRGLHGREDGVSGDAGWIEHQGFKGCRAARWGCVGGKTALLLSNKKCCGRAAWRGVGRGQWPQHGGNATTNGARLVESEAVEGSGR
jgi:hypothetical protein